MEISGTFPRIVSKQIGIGYIVSLLYFCLNSDLTKCRKHTSREPGKPTADVVDSGILRAFHAPTMHGAPPRFPAAEHVTVLDTAGTAALLSKG